MHTCKQQQQEAIYHLFFISDIMKPLTDYAIILSCHEIPFSVSQSVACVCD